MPSSPSPSTTRRALAALSMLAACAAPMAAAAQDSGACPPAASAEERPPRFAASSSCALCHSNAPAASAMRDAKGREVSPYALWSGTAMANSFHDVIWRAAVAAEVAASPSHEREIVGTCLRCHAPMGARTLPAERVSLALLQPGRAEELTADGVSCAVCHRIAAEGLGEPSTFVGAFRLLEDGQIAGPHQDPFTMPMMRHTGFEPVYGPQLLEPGLCATCHTVITAPLGATRPGAAFLEQAPYLEWRNSAFAAGGKRAATCQACHAPELGEDGARIETRIARNPRGRDFPPIEPRRPFGRHVFLGGNTLLPKLLADAPAGAAGAPRPPFEAVAAATARQLSTRTARVEIEGALLAGRALSFVARVENLTGHKFPTGHPSRRAWLRVRVRDAAGRVAFASGEHDAAGRILGASGRPLASEDPGSPPQPHRAVVRERDEVQVYESVMEDEHGALTEKLLQAFRPRKDDRLLPAGWSPQHPDAARTRPVGTGGDRDFEAGRDAVAFELQLPSGLKRPLRIEVALLYQSLGARHATELVRGDSDAARALAAALARHGNAPDTVAQASSAVR